MRRFILISLLVLSWGSARAAVDVTLIGDRIPSRYLTGATLLFYESDSLYLNGRLLTRGEDYRVDADPAAFDLSALDLQAGIRSAWCILRCRAGCRRPSVDLCLK